MTEPDESWDRWRLILGEAAHQTMGAGLSPDALGRDAALDWLYGRDADADGRGVRSPARSGGSGPSQLTTVEWLDQIFRLFPKETIERLET